MSRRRGSVAIEFALSFTLLFTILAGVFQFGYSYHIYQTLESTVRAAGRYASARAYDSATTTPSAAFTDAVRRMAVYGNPDGTGQPVAPNFTTAHVTLTVTFDRNVPARVAVAIQNYRIDGIFGVVTLLGKPAGVFPYLGRYAPP